MKKVYLAVIYVFMLSLCACEVHTPAESPRPSQMIVSMPEALPSEPAPQEPHDKSDPVSELLSGMTLEEKVGQLFFVRTPREDVIADIQQYHLGGLILFGEDTEEKTANELIQTLQSYQDAATLPLLIGADEEGGTVVRLSSNPHLSNSRFPSPQELFAQGGLDAVRAGTREKNIFLRAMGVNVNLAPVADVSTDPSDYIHKRTLGQDAQATADYISVVTQQMARDQVGSVLKHFPGYGNNVDTHTGISVDTRPLETFQTADFLPFLAGFEAGGETTAVMVSHNIMTCVDDTRPASLSPAVHELLRKELNFGGVIMTDDLYMDAVAAYGEDGRVAVMALQAGNDMLATTNYREEIPAVLEAIKNGDLTEEQIEGACMRVLKWKQALGLFSASE